MKNQHFDSRQRKMCSFLQPQPLFKKKVAVAAAGRSPVSQNLLKPMKNQHFDSQNALAGCLAASGCLAAWLAGRLAAWWPGGFPGVPMGFPIKCSKASRA